MDLTPYEEDDDETLHRKLVAAKIARKRAEEDLKLRGFGDLVGYQQSGIKSFRFADPVIHDDLFKLAEKYVQNMRSDIDQNKYSFLLKLFDRAEIKLTWRRHWKTESRREV